MKQVTHTNDERHALSSVKHPFLAWLWVTWHGHIKLTDFGFANLVPHKTWTLYGAPDYVAPEVMADECYNKSVDW
ncbi:unnamed protein product [Clonostachys rhizophaga]|uniref:cAMP-dependent protein kinase n=1 Tax=Clonostachys rhizophaga TaxID=160324 RepID=A0A9N9VM61_9HYPO|nr:unnamed protein product [Clonostachys rhizophaga]